MAWVTRQGIHRGERRTLDLYRERPSHTALLAPATTMPRRESDATPNATSPLPGIIRWGVSKGERRITPTRETILTGKGPPTAVCYHSRRWEHTLLQGGHWSWPRLPRDGFRDESRICSTGWVTVWRVWIMTCSNHDNTNYSSIHVVNPCSSRPTYVRTYYNTYIVRRPNLNDSSSRP